jgi:hypothetical protein
LAVARRQTIANIEGMTLATTASAMAPADDQDGPSDRELASRPRSMQWDPVDYAWHWLDPLRKRWSPQPTGPETLDLAIKLKSERALARKLETSPQTIRGIIGESPRAHPLIQDGVLRRLDRLVDLMGSTMIEPAKSAEVEAAAPKNGTAKP